MGEHTAIAWADRTFNIAWGCQKISAGCRGCYAETWDKRWSGNHWGPNQPRRTFDEKYWRRPLKWNRQAGATPQRVFCSSMTDVFMDDPVLDTERSKLWKLIEETPNLLWLLLTKRPENVMRMLPKDGYWRNKWGMLPANVHIGTSIENKETLPRMIELLRIPAQVRFVSHEPLLSMIASPFEGTSRVGIDGLDDELLQCKRCGAGVWDTEEVCPNCQSPYRLEWSPCEMLHWAIVGGESGPTARRMDPAWARELRNYYQSVGIAFFFKQAGTLLAKEWQCKHSAGAHLQELPAEFQIQEFPDLENN